MAFEGADFTTACLTRSEVGSFEGRM